MQERQAIHQNTGRTTSHGNGYGEQKFSAAAYKASGGKWQILDIDENGTITLISDAIYRDNVSTGKMGINGFYLKNGVGYLWAEEELHRISAIYGYGKGADTSRTIEYYYGGPNDQDGSIAEIDEDNDGTIDNLAELQQGRKTTLKVDGTEEILTSGARSITAADINKICGTDTTYTSNYSSSTVTKVSGNAKYYPTFNTTSAIGQSAAQTSFSGSYYDTAYSYAISSVNSDTTVATNQNNMINIGTEYLLGTREIKPSSSVTWFRVSSVNPAGYKSYRSVLQGYNKWVIYDDVYGAVRAIVTLKSGIQTSDTEYDSTNGWTIAE